MQVLFQKWTPNLNIRKVIQKSQSKENNKRECFGSQDLGANPFGLSSTGFNVSTYDFKDKSKHSVSHKYGSSSIIKNHPCCDVNLIILFIF